MSNKIFAVLTCVEATPAMPRAASACMNRTRDVSCEYLLYCLASTDCFQLSVR